MCYLRDGDRVFETYWTTGRGVEAVDHSYAFVGHDRLWAAGDVGGLARRLAADLPLFRTNGRPTAQWSRLEAGRDDDLSVTSS